MSEGVARSGPSASSPREVKAPGSSTLQARTLPPIQNVVQTSTSQDMFHRAPAAASPIIRPQTASSTTPDQRSSRPIGVQNLLNPTAFESTAVSNQRNHGSQVNSPPTPSSLGPNSRGTTPAISTTSGQTRSPIDAAVPHATPPSVGAFPVPLGRSITPRSPTTWPQTTIIKGVPTGTIDARQSPFVLSREEAPTSNGSMPPSLTDAGNSISGQQRSYPPPLPRAPSPLRQSSQDSSYQSWQGYERSGSGNPQLPSSQHGDGAHGAYPFNHTSQSEQGVGHPPAPTGQPQSFFSNPFSGGGPASTMSQPGLNRAKAFDMPASSTTAQSQYQMMTLETESGPIQVPVDVQAASKVADEKRKRNATASHRFRQRRKEKERETSENISKLESQIRDVTDEKDHYQKERDFLQDFILRHRIPLPPRPPSPRRRRHATMSGASLPPYQDSESDERSGRQTRRRTTAYVPPTGPPQQMATEGATLPHFERLSAMPSEMIQGVNRVRPQSSFPPSTGPYQQPPPR